MRSRDPNDVRFYNHGMHVLAECIRGRQGDEAISAVIRDRCVLGCDVDYFGTTIAKPSRLGAG